MRAGHYRPRMRALTAVAAIAVLLCVLWLFGFGCQILYPPSFWLRQHTTAILKATAQEPDAESWKRIREAAVRLQRVGTRVAEHERHATIAHLVMIVVLVFTLYVLGKAHRIAGGR